MLLPPPSPRAAHALACLLTIPLGLASRHYAASLPPFLAEYAGDTLYATTAFFCLSFVAPRLSVGRRAAMAIACCYAVELSQLLHPAWLDRLRSTTAGHVVLGQGFVWSDLVCYAAGVTLAVGIELLVRAISGARSPAPRAD